MTTRDASSGETITLTDLARLAGVGRNAVSNWRRRETDFPEPVDESSRRPRFDLHELEQWAERHGRRLDITGADRLWFTLAGAHPTAEAALGAVAAAFSGSEPAIADQLKDLQRETPASDLFEFFIERAREAAGTGVPPGIAPLADIAAAVTQGLTRPAVHDPACDEGDLLAETARRTGPCRILSGQDLSAPRTAIAEQRLRLLDDNAEVVARVGDSLLQSLPGERYDLVVCDPPFNVKDSGTNQYAVGDDPRLAYGTPPRTEPELAWALHCIALLAPGGHAVVRMPAQVAHRRTGRRIRSELLRWGALRAVVDSPEAKAHIWILAPRGETTQLLVSGGADFADAWRQFTTAPDAPITTTDSTTVPLMRLWDEDVDISPAVYLASTTGNAASLAESVAGLGERLEGLARHPLPRFGIGAEESAPETSLADLERGGHLAIVPGSNTEPVEPQGPTEDTRCVIVDPVGEPQVRLGRRSETTETQWTVVCEPTVDLGWIAAALAARLPTATKRTATGAKRRLLSVKIPRITLAEQQRRGAAYTALEDLRAALAQAEAEAEALAAEAAAGLVSGTVTIED
ncbi:N-6 DNA methylase [Glycomyces algeriensis]|uniref:SAM-dependent methyltransferase n=1 Tax=Glycomyces algeriensis TaxID=256037 RepID=A0A9W6G583_9ACTN|nr:N-6 DNA methylase [Glycomyces algeriensis]MDA1367754.1 N-6 DNA methylase [Glycomyces algeriensis]MDR7352882.1 putative DNA-binding transcriptional regulator AlpA [Glycomyces algeriensis]GLI40569.1 SAM-dependent methyltransferase [Glycomyces algeriensis]